MVARAPRAMRFLRLPSGERPRHGVQIRHAFTPCQVAGQPPHTRAGYSLLWKYMRRCCCGVRATRPCGCHVCHPVRRRVGGVSADQGSGACGWSDCGVMERQARKVAELVQAGNRPGNLTAGTVSTGPGNLDGSQKTAQPQQAGTGKPTAPCSGSCYRGWSPTWDSPQDSQRHISPRAQAGCHKRRFLKRVVTRPRAERHPGFRPVGWAADEVKVADRLRPRGLVRGTYPQLPVVVAVRQVDLTHHLRRSHVRGGPARQALGAVIRGRSLYRDGRVRGRHGGVRGGRG